MEEVEEAMEADLHPTQERSEEAEEMEEMEETESLSPSSSSFLRVDSSSYRVDDKDGIIWEKKTKQNLKKKQTNKIYNVSLKLFLHLLLSLV